MPLEIADKDLGGARVRLTFQTILKDGSTRRFKANDQLSAEDVLAWPMANRRALTSAGYIEIYPRQAAGRQAIQKGDRFIVQARKDQYNVIEGRRINDQPLSREEAEELAKQKG
jgi:hypothetical protein